ncbi:hypothetical protein SDRG_16907 [Saprolegnia diclina VS20]|uniref:Uncharacterized protein n=1 Tax=Saprolegnia diclina (strain VS20) TaxID=1156394 RepID=T0PIK5_SAPDV|nr:hypothetical protein SDRG_16907 [Saprolegnia diclina VS20]EQC25209.1 hypothetical protein SDRG_16907 [Saprolegnia diclina VS20]|eukprot:XP_008621353.1 hypothetical protein SDRG_16907 [Saprolegnia diclina VS20]
MSEVCILKGPDDFSRWWSSGSQDYQLYLGVVLLFFSLVIALPMAKFGLFLLRYATGDVYLKPDEAHEMLLWETHWLLRVGLFCWALQVVGLTSLLCQWPLWVFGVPLLLWVNAVGNVYRLITVRKGSAKTLLHEGVTVLKILVLVILFYFIYILVFPGIAENIIRAFFTGFCSLVALATVPVVRNVTGSQFILFNHALRQRLHVFMASTPPGMLLDVPLGYVITTCDAYSKTFVPAGKALTTPLVMFAENTPEADEPRWPLRLRIRLPPTLHVAAVRRFLQDVDSRLRKADERAALHPHRNAMFAATAATPTLLRKQLPPTREEDRLCVSIEGRWIVHVFGDIAAKSREVFRDRLSQKVQLIMSIVETHALTANLEQA